MTFSPIDLVSAHRWRRVVFTTYSLSLSFFEAVVLDALVRGGAQEAFILSDVLGVKAALGEQGARRVGKEYHVEPVSVMNGVFHPKVSAFVGDEDCHLLVGSGNLTFGGWGGNFEVVEHLHSALAPDAIEDAANFFVRIAESDRLRHTAASRCSNIANDLRTSIQGRPRNGNIRLFHSLDGAISDRLIQAADDLGGARRLAIASPFWDSGAAVDDLCRRLGLSTVLVHAHPGGSVEGRDGSNWPVAPSVTVTPVELDDLAEKKPRRLHAKVFEILCRRGRLVVSGSPNASGAALGANGNVEACVVRIQRETLTGWSYEASERPELVVAAEDEDEEEESTVGVLTATLDGDRIEGQVLIPVMTGNIAAFQLSESGAKRLGQAEVNEAGRFALRTPGLEAESWSGGGRLVLRVEDANGRQAEGFVAVSAFAEISRRAGPMAARLMALLSGGEMPDDVRYIMEWFHDDPSRLLGAARLRVGGGSDDEAAEGRDDRRTIDVDTLTVDFASRYHGPVAEGGAGAGWQRFLDHVMSAFRAKRGPFRQDALVESDDDDDDRAHAPVDLSTDPAIPRLISAFERLFELLLSPDNAARHALTAFDLTCYMCERLKPGANTAARWLDHLLTPLVSGKWPAERTEDIAAAIVLAAGVKADASRIRTARGRLLRLGYDLAGPPPSFEEVRRLADALQSSADFDALWRQIGSVRTLAEQVRAYLVAFEARRPGPGYEDLKQFAREDWSALEKAITQPAERQRVRIVEMWVDSCPDHSISLSVGDQNDLRSAGMARTRSCCNRILINKSV